MDAGNDHASPAMDAGPGPENQSIDAGGGQEITSFLDGGTASSGSGSAEMTSVCVELETPDGGFGESTGLVRGERDGTRITVTVTLFNVNCGITEFIFVMEEQQNNEVLRIMVSPVGLTTETPLTRCHCDMDLKGEYWDDDESLQTIEAYFNSVVVLDNAEAIPANGFIGEAEIQ